jgi:glycosyltransferase involved in cell wall biosynthesis
MYEGPSQLLPFVSSHQEIADTKERRYSIWNGDVYYSVPNQSRPWYLRSLFAFKWIVPINKKTSFLLPVACERIVANSNALADGLGHLVEETNRIRLNSIEPKKIVLYTHGLSAGGAERQWCNLAIGLKELGKCVYIVVESYLGVNGHYLDMVRSAGIEVLQTSDEKEYQLDSNLDKNLFPLFDRFILPTSESMAKLATLLIKLKPDAVVAQLDTTNITGAIASLLTDVPNIVLSFRNYNPTHFDYLNLPWLLPAYQTLVRSSRIIMTGNSRLGNVDYARWIGVDEDKIHLLRNAYKPDSTKLLSTDEKQDFRNSLGIDSEKKVILGAFRLSREKNPKLFVDTCVQILLQNQDAVALLCGGGSMHDELENIIAKAGLSDRLQIRGPSLEIWKFLCVADVLLLTSDVEGTPNIVREALMLHCPVVSTACGSVPEMIEDGVNGHIAPIGDLQTLVESVERVLYDDRHRAGLIQHIKANQDVFTPKDKARLLLSILRGNLSRSGTEVSVEQHLKQDHLQA